MEPIIICQDLKLGFGANILVEHLSFTIEKGSYLCIVGENGAGKSTLLRALLGLLLSPGKVPVTGLCQPGDLHLLHRFFGDLFFFPVIKRPQPAASLTAGQHDLPHGSGEITLHKGLLGQIPYFPAAQSFTQDDAAR